MRRPVVMLIPVLLAALSVAPHAQFGVLGKLLGRGTPVQSQVELVGSQIGSTGSNGGSGNTIAKVLDADFSTFYDAANASGDWVGVDAGSTVTITGVKFAPRRGASGLPSELAYENRSEGAQLQVSSDPTFASDVTTVYTIETAPPANTSNQWNSRTITGAPSKRYARWLGPTSGRCNLAELRFLANAGPSSAKPVQPNVSPYGGRFPAGSTRVTLTSATTTAVLYYTTDGTTPDATKTRYTGAFTLSTGTNTTLKVIAIDPALGTPSSDVSTAYFAGYGLKPLDDWYDDQGHLVEANSGGWLTGAGNAPLEIGGYYWWFGTNANRYNNVTVNDGNGATGVLLYKSLDFVNPNFIYVGNILGPTGGFTYVLRPHALLNPITHKFVVWAHLYSIPASASDRAGVATTTDIGCVTCYTWVNSSLNPDGVGFKDCNLFLDVDGKTGYVIYTNGSQSAILVSKLAADFLSAGIATVTAVSGSRESPALVVDHEGKYALFHSVSNYYDSTLTYDEQVTFATSPLGPWSASRSAFATDPLGTSYTAQISQVLKFTNGWLTVGDHWVAGTSLDQSRQVWLPVDDLVQEPASWDLSRFTAPTNHLLSGLAAFFPLSELSDTDNAVERVGGLTASLTGALSPNYHGIRLRSRLFADGNYFQAANHATFQTGDIQVWWNVWVYRTAGGQNRVIFTKDDQAAHREYGLYWDVATDRLKFYVSNDGTAITTVTANTFGSLPTNTWTMVTVWHDSVANELGIEVNDSSVDTVSYSAGITTTTTAFAIGDFGPHVGNVNWNGRIRDLGMWKAAKPGTTQLDPLYNSGKGLPYDYFTP